MSSLPGRRLDVHPPQIIMVDRVLSEVQSLVILEMITLHYFPSLLSSLSIILHNKLF